ncbi:MAG TPA: hypothetical protein VFC82_10245 [Actinomycetaceae bacterium]|nr:hypothetical protein [Actinomycetaceae bacterium]
MRFFVLGTAALAAVLLLAGCAADPEETGNASVSVSSVETGAAGARDTGFGGATAQGTAGTPDATGTAGTPGGSAEDRALLERSVEFLNAATSFLQEGVVKTVTDIGEADSIGSDMTFETEFVRDPLQFSTRTTIVAMGQSFETRTVVVPEGEGLRIYQVDPISNSWTAFVMTHAEADTQGITRTDPLNDVLDGHPENADVESRQMKAATPTGNVDAYELTVTLPHALVDRLVVESADSDADSFEGAGTLVYVVAADDGAPITAVVEITGTLDAQGTVADFSVTSRSSFSRWNELTSIEVPPEALEAAQISVP